jgi:protein-arginine kinase activator protein McsA
MEITIICLLTLNSVLLFLIVAAIVNGMIKHKKVPPPPVRVMEKPTQMSDLDKYLTIIAVTETDLRNELIRCLENEEYERASRIRDILEKAKRNRDDLP